jgi:hypothetical protein
LYHAIYTAQPGSDGSIPTEDFTFAGAAGLTSASDVDQAAELGWIIILPRFQVRMPTLTVSFNLTDIS